MNGVGITGYQYGKKRAYLHTRFKMDYGPQHEGFKSVKLLEEKYEKIFVIFSKAKVA